MNLRTCQVWYARLVEAKTSLQGMLLTIPRTDDERAAVDKGADAVERLLTGPAASPLTLAIAVGLRS
jgi:hypothetical protein